ncbi:glycosyltransferase family 8 protein [Paenibacillus dokdonensis]|uniref:Glycosyltransferase family 8 protein n=1 Tax=Paenibacillus dokdonensis TaxID=2567944 RepID=A0ABU6GLD8_9BACL|nr:glycosyltransferase family 8 protein [Paenibacillus dokdonensis]MEC0240179.1 glycosyltransferase family 8 protein [Paenibacillus dokdonensis]
MIELALAFNDKDGSYAEHAAVVLTTVFRNTGSPINVHILHDETLTEENKNRLAQLTSGFNHTINFYPVALPAEMAEALAGVGSIDKWTSGSMYRLLLPSVIPANKVIYLDCDILVNMDLTELWETELNGCYLGAIRDQGIMGVADIVRVHGLNPDTYFNSGVIVFELNNIRQQMNWFEEMVNFLRSFPSTTMPDQDVLNHVFGGNCLLLDERFNSFYINGADQDLNQKIVHFAGDIKCWDPLSPGFALYQENLNFTPWRAPRVNTLKNRNGKRKMSRKGRHLLLKRRTRRLSSGNPSLMRSSRRPKMKKRTKRLRTPSTTSTLGTRRKLQKNSASPARKKRLSVQTELRFKRQPSAAPTIFMK